MKLWNAYVEITQIGDKEVNYEFEDLVVTGDDRECAEDDAVRTVASMLDEMGVDFSEGFAPFISLNFVKEI